MGLDVEVISSKRAPIEIYSYFSRIGMLDVNRTIAEANPDDYVGVLVPGGAKSPALLAEDPAVLAFLRAMKEQKKEAGGGGSIFRGLSCWSRSPESRRADT